MVAQVLETGGYPWVPMSDAGALPVAPVGGWGGAIVATDHSSAGAWEVVTALRSIDPAVGPIVMLISSREIDDLKNRDALYDDFCLTPCEPREFERRLQHTMWRAGNDDNVSELVMYEDLVLNVETYEAAVGGEPLELTHMEYELLRYLASSPGRVFTREVLLSQVWGYDYFGGARTVDVHIRRLRSKLGQDHASLIQTVRSVGYSLGQSRWASTT